MNLKIYAMESTLVDLTFINECFGDETSLQIEVINLFLTNTPEKMQLLEKSILDNDYKDIASNAHFLKSTFGTMGIPLNNEFSEIENLARENQELEKIKSILNQSRTKYQLSIQEYQNLLNKLSSSS